MNARSMTAQQPYMLAFVGVVMLMFYAAVQTILSSALPPQSDLKVVLESQLLLVGLMLHAQWRAVNRLFAEMGRVRPSWIVTADCLSFVITFWALAALMRVFID